MYKNLLIYRSASLGDSIVSLPAIKIIIEKNPHTNIYYLSIKNNDLNSVSPKNIINRITKIKDFLDINNPKSLQEIINLVFYLKKYNFNKIYYLNEDRQILKKIRDYFFFRFLLGKKIIGLNIFKKNKEFYEGLYLAKKICNINYIKIIKIINELKQKFKTNSKTYISLVHSDYISISPGGRIESKKWGIKNWRDLISKIIKKNQKIKIIIVGQRNDIKQNILISKNYKKNIINLTGKTSLDQLINIIDKSSLHLCHDDGTMHLANLLNKNIISIFHNLNFKEKWFFNNNKKNIQFYNLKGITNIQPNKIFAKINNCAKLNNIIKNLN